MSSGVSLISHCTLNPTGLGLDPPTTKKKLILLDLGQHSTGLDNIVALLLLAASRHHTCLHPSKLATDQPATRPTTTSCCYISHPPWCVDVCRSTSRPYKLQHKRLTGLSDPARFSPSTTHFSSSYPGHTFKQKQPSA